MKIDWVALVRAHQDYFDFKKAEIARLIESVVIFEKRLSELEIRFAEWQESQMNVLDMR